MAERIQDFHLRLRTLRSAERLQVSKTLPDLLAQIMANATTGPVEAALQADTAQQLAALLRTLREASLVQRVLLCLLEMGIHGRTQISLFVQARTMPLAQLTPIITTNPMRQVLGLANTLLLRCPPGDKQYAAWLKTLVPAPERVEPREALLFLKVLAQHRTPLAEQLRACLLASALPETIQKNLSGTPGPGTAEVLLRACEELGTSAMASVALEYCLRTAGRTGPNRLSPLLFAEHDHPGRDTALALEMRRLAAQADAPAMLAPALAGEPEVLGLVLAQMLCEKATEARTALRLLPLLPWRGLEPCLDSLPAEARPKVLGSVFASQVGTDADLLRRYAKAHGQGLTEEVLEALRLVLQSQTTASIQDPEALPLFPLPARQQPAGRRPSLTEAVSDRSTLKDCDFSGATLTGNTLAGMTFSSVDFSACDFDAVVFQRTRFNACTLNEARFNNCVFQDCAFATTAMIRSRFQGCRFDSCTFDSCDLPGVTLHSSALESCSLADCSLLGTIFSESRLRYTTLRNTSFSGVQLRACALMSCSFSRCDISGGFWNKTVCHDTDFDVCSLAFTTIVNCDVVTLRLRRVDLSRVRVMGGHNDDPLLEEARQATTHARIMEQRQLAVAPALLSGQGALFVRECVQARLRVDEAKATLCAMRLQDRRRHELALERLTPEQGTFLELLPALLVTDVLEKHLGLEGVPACCLADRAAERAPSPAEVAQLSKLFPKHTPTPKPRPILRIEAVYAIGSLGSVAQKATSDVDCWLCYSPDAPDPAVVQGLKRKLAALESWAMQQYALEVHFFAMPLAEVRANAFGISDKESSGSAQALLLKEEFYRTALKLGGRDLAWWAAPPGAEDKAVHALLAELSVLAPRVALELVDLGQPAPIPPGEYFGACLWQMVKALHSPYKSVMKLALLEKYAGQGPAMRLLCERIKEAAMRGRNRPESLDPYLALFASTSKHYAALGDSSGLDLLCECLLLKAVVDPAALPAELVRAGGTSEDAGTFAHSMRLGGMVSRFMVEAYSRIQEGLRAAGTTTHITPEDMTRLGRRIAVNFGTSEHKVGLVPFLSEGLRFTELFFYAEKAPGKRTIWAVKGKEKDTGKASVESLAPIRRDTDPARLLAWLAINGIAGQGQTVHAEKTLAPIAIMDIQALLAELTAFFPRQETLSPDMDEALHSECVTRAFVVLNLPSAQDKNKILHASVVHATNWGELCCQTFENPSPLLAKSPVNFLRESLAKPLSPEVQFGLFIPKKSACPRIKIL